jgi:hypothetical protein
VSHHLSLVGIPSRTSEEEVFDRLSRLAAFAGVSISDSDGVEVAIEMGHSSPELC